MTKGEVPSRRQHRAIDESTPRRVALVSVHTSPLEQPGTGDAGGMNVYVIELATRLARRGVEVEIFTRATESGADPVVQQAPGVTVRHILAGPLQGLSKEDLPGQLCAFAAGMMRTEAHQDVDYYDLIHTHYWLSGQVGWLAADRWHVPLVHTMHTMGKVKNAHMADGDTLEPAGRIIGEEQVVAEADRLIANTEVEKRELVEFYDADPSRIAVVPPGVDLNLFTPSKAQKKNETGTDRAELGYAADDVVLLFVGRIQPLKAPELVLKAAARLFERTPELRNRLKIAIVGGPSGSGLQRPDSLIALAEELQLTDLVRFQQPVPREELPTWYRAADVVLVPSHSESFGLVAIEAQACGTPVIAADVGGLATAVDPAVSGLLVDGHDTDDWATAVETLLDDETRARHGRRAVEHAARFGWEVTVDATLDVYRGARAERLDRLRDGAA